MKPEQPAISLQSVRKRFGQFCALDGVDLEVPAGTIQGLLGPNGAGKTTTVRVLTTLLEPDEGEVFVAGHSVRHEAGKVREALGVSGQYAAVDDKLTGPENLTLVGQLYGMRRRAAKARASELLEYFRLDGVPADRLAGSYSGGMRRRLDLAGAIVAKPPVVVLDEPTTGLDPRGRRDTWEAIAALRDEGTTILLTTQYLEEADALADSVAVIDAGRIAAVGTSAELKARTGGARIDLRLMKTTSLELASAALNASGMPTSIDAQAQRLSTDAPYGDRSLVRALSALRKTGVDVVEAALRQPTLDEVFLRITADSPGSRGTDSSAAHTSGVLL